MGNDVLVNIVDDKQDIKNQLGSFPAVTPSLKSFSTTIEIIPRYTELLEDAIGTAMIWGHATNSTWGTQNWGGSTTRTLFALLPFNNDFFDSFIDDKFIDTGATTATVNVGSIDFTSGQILQSTVITKLREPITKVSFDMDGISDNDPNMLLGTLQLGISTFTEDNSEVFVSNDSGATWESVLDLDAGHTFSSSATTDELKYRVIASTTFTASGPIIISVNK